MSKVNFLNLLFVSLSVICHVVAAVQFLIMFKPLDLPTEFFPQFFVLLLLSFLLSGVVRVLKGKKYVVLIVFSHTVVFILMGYPLSSYLGIELSILIVLVVETVFYIVSPYNFFTSITIIVLSLLLQRSAVAWGRVYPAPSPDSMISLGLYAIVILVFSYLVKKLLENLKIQISQVERMDEAVKQLMSANIGFQQYAIRQEETSKISERKRVTREIHDTIGYTLTNVIMMMEAITSLIKTGPHAIGKINELADGVKKQAQDGLREVRRALHLLREDEGSEISGLRAINKIVKAFGEATRVKINVDFGNMPWELGKQYGELMYRLVQEGMTNAFRHGKATEIWIRFWRDETGIYVTIRDNGSGSSKVKKGIGLLGMTERVSSMGGRIEAHNVIDGFELAVWIPTGGDL